MTNLVTVVGIIAAAFVASCTTFGDTTAGTASRQTTNRERSPPAAQRATHDVAPMTARGSDTSLLPTRYPAGDWLPIEAPLLSMVATVEVHVHPVALLSSTASGEARAVPAIATLDTGAMKTMVSIPMAHKLGLASADARASKRIIDAHGRVLDIAHGVIRELHIGRRSWRDLEVVIAGEDPELFLVGADVLQTLDLFLAADEGLIGIFDAGRAPSEMVDAVIPLERQERQLIVHGQAPAHGRSHAVDFPLLIDTGAWNTTVPLITGINGGLSADLRYADTSRAVGGELSQRGRFVLNPLLLGPSSGAVKVGRVLAVGSVLTDKSAEGIGLLGNDVLMRQHTVISFARAQLRLRPVTSRPAVRWKGPQNEPCLDDAGSAVPCVQVALQANATHRPDDDVLPGVCLDVKVDKAYAGQTLELAITAADAPLMNGGAIRAFVTVNNQGEHECFSLWRQLGDLGLSVQTPLSLRWVRTESMRWPCDPLKTKCITFSGPLTELPVK